MKRIFAAILAMAIISGITILSHAFYYKGDVTEDDKITSDDALMVLRYAVGKVNSINVKVADMNSDGKINAVDALYILETIAGTREKSVADVVDDRPTEAPEFTEPATDSTTKPTTKPTTDKSNEEKRKEELEKENKRHEDELARIKSKYEYRISDYESYINSAKAECGVYYLSSSYYYEQRASALKDEINKLISDMAYLKRDTMGGNSGQIARLQNEIDAKNTECKEMLLLANVAKAQDELESLKYEYYGAVDFENSIHQDNINKINNKYK